MLCVNHINIQCTRITFICILPSPLFFSLEPFNSSTEPLASGVGRIGSPRWIPDVTTGNDFFWILRTDLEDIGRGFIFNFPIVHAGDSPLCDSDNQITFRLGSTSGPVVVEYCLSDLQSRAIFVPTTDFYSDLVISFKTADLKEYGFIAKYAEGELNSNLKITS